MAHGKCPAISLNDILGCQMKRFIEGAARSQSTMLAELLAGYVDGDNDRARSVSGQVNLADKKVRLFNSGLTT